MTYKPGLDKFKELCRQEFRFLEDEYGFAERELPKEGLINRFQVQYVNTTTFVAVEGIHWGGGVGVGIGRAEPEAWETYRNYSLEDLLVIRCPDLSLIGPDGFGVSDDQAFQINHYAHALKKCADDVLRGEFSILPKLHEAIERRKYENAPSIRESIGSWLGLIELIGLWAWSGLRKGLRRRSKK